MATALGLAGLLAFIVFVILLAAAITWTVIKLTPQRDQAEKSS
jgi:hypothetical protein